jgi:phenylalanine-4-hydroxylase
MDHEVWATLAARQQQISAALDELRHQRAMGMTPDRIPCSTTSTACCGHRLGTGRRQAAAELTFFEHLANRRFPVTDWLRTPAEFDYVVKPDVFHDFFGHVRCCSTRCTPTTWRRTARAA